MASLILLLIFSTITATKAQQRTSNISLGSSLSPTGNSSWLSPSGLFAFGFFPKGNGFAVGIWFTRTPQRTVVWTANRDDPPIPSSANLLFSSDDRRLVLRQFSGRDIAISSASVRASSASILDSGNLVLYDGKGAIIWQSFDRPTDTLLSGQYLVADNWLVSSTSQTNHSAGILMLVLQSDGNLVMYPKDLILIETAYYSTNTAWAGDNVTLVLDRNGDMYLRNSSGVNFRSIVTSGSSSVGSIYRVTLDFDGILRLYSHNLDQNGNWSIEWSSTGDGCAVKGICGINQYCVPTDQQPVCTCFPGYVPIDQEQKNLGCRRNFVAENCVSGGDHLRYEMNELENTMWWIYGTYSVLDSVTKNECNQACLEDCSCEAAIFENRQCKKQKLPLRFGRRVVTSGTVTLIKAGSGGLVDAVVPKKSKNKLQISILITSIVLLIFSFLALALACILIARHRFRAYTLIPDGARNGLIEDVSLRSFTYEELRKATNGFTKELGRGAFGIVFKGVLSNEPKEIAVKRLEKVVAEVEFRNEMRSIGRTHHRNLVRLLGYCHDQSNRLLVYEYMSNGSLADFYFKSEKKPSWGERISVALNIARGIHYLHEECEMQIIHCDINPNNILMDENLCPKISDFGLAKLMMPEQSRTITAIRGTRGYVAPEWYKNQPVTAKADVYSFGIVFLEILCCRRNVCRNAPENEAILAEWVCNCFEGNQVRKLVSEDEVGEEPLRKMVSLGVWCIQEEPSRRPSMKNVILMLEGVLQVPAPPNAVSFCSTLTSFSVSPL